MRLFVVLAVLIFVGACGSDDDDGGASFPACDGLHVSIPDHPFSDNDLIAPAGALLDGLARESCEARGGTVPEVTQFLFGSAPVSVFESLLRNDPADVDFEGSLWVLHLSGYFGGVWLRREIVSAQPDSFIANIGSTPTEADFLAEVESVRPATVAARAVDDAEVLAYLEAIFLELVDGFGYNKGYLLQILEVPPEGLSSPADLALCEGPLSCVYEPLALEALGDFDAARDRLGDPPDDAWDEIAQSVLGLQDQSEARGRMVWSSGLSVQGFSQESYEVLLDVSSSFLQVVQATALAAAQSLAESKADVGRRASAADAGFRIWIDSYTMGLLDGRSDRELPEISRD
jgi:hypothetical protein